MKKVEVKKIVSYLVDGRRYTSLTEVTILLIQNAVRGSTGANGEESFAEYFKFLPVKVLQDIKEVIEWRLEQEKHNED